jgi:ATP10 protein
MLRVSVQRRTVFNIFNFYKESAKTPGQLRVKRDLERGYWWDANQMVKNPDGKFIESSGLKPLDRKSSSKLDACSWPPLRSLGNRGRVSLNEDLVSRAHATLVVFSFERLMADKLAMSWRRKLHEANERIDDVPKKQRLRKVDVPRVVEIVLVESVLSWLLGPLFFERTLRNVLRKQADEIVDVDEVLQSTLHRYANVTEMRERFELENRYCVYPMLVDRYARVRWRASGLATDADIEQLVCVSSALREEERVHSMKRSKK